MELYAVSLVIYPTHIVNLSYNMVPISLDLMIDLQQIDRSYLFEQLGYRINNLAQLQLISK